MIKFDVPDFKEFQIEHIVMDVNGTIALDGTLIEGTADLLKELSQHIKVHMLTADTYGKQADIAAQLGFAETHIIQHGGSEKAKKVAELGADKVVALGNGANDLAMCEAAALGIAVVGPEGAAGVLIRSADIVVRDINEGLALLLNTQRLRAVLRR